MRRRRILWAIAVLAVMSWSLMLGGVASAAPPGSDARPVPIPAIFPGTPFHVLAPGPEEVGLMGVDVEPSTITNFNGLSGYAVFTGRAVDADGNPYDAVLDMRVFVGEYVSADGTHHHGTFGFI